MYTKIWDDSFFSELSPSEKLLFLYYITNQHINIIHLYECSDKKVCYDTGLNHEQISKAKAKFEAAHRIYFFGNFVFLRNASKYQKYTGELNERAKDKLFAMLSKDVLDWYNSVLDTPINTPSHTLYIGTRNKKSEIRNKKLEGESERETSEVQAFIDFFNKLSGKSYTVTESRSDKFAARRKKYSLDDIKLATESLLKSPYHTGKNDAGVWYATPDFLLRNDEMVDKWRNQYVRPAAKGTVPDWVIGSQKDI